MKDVIKATLRVPIDSTSTGNSSQITRDLEGVLILQGFKLSPQLYVKLESLDPKDSLFLSRKVLSAVKELIGSHVNHNVYFKDFPENIPDTEDFWLSCILDALENVESADKISFQLSFGVVNLLDLPKYGKYLHSYEDMVTVHEVFTGIRKPKILQLGGSLEEEYNKLFYSLAESKIPLSDENKELLVKLAAKCPDATPNVIVKENLSLINITRIKAGNFILADTLTDVLRLACALSESDETLATVTKFKSFPRSIRRIILSKINSIVEANSDKLADINKYSERWKRLFERLHPWEYRQYPNAQKAHDVAMGNIKVVSIESRLASLLNTASYQEALKLYEKVPGILYRNLDYLLRLQVPGVIEVVKETASKVSTKVLLEVVEHLLNRLNPTKRIFTNTKGKSWVTDDSRNPIPNKELNEVLSIIDAELASRLPDDINLVIHPNAGDIALPKSNKNGSEGIGVMPRGSRLSIGNEGNRLRFFMYWKEKEERTDYDLSCLYLDENFVMTGQSSYTNLRGDGHVHSGDITSAPNGASEFIEVDLTKIKDKYIVPQVNVFAGESFENIEESFFGYMERNSNEKGLPYEPTTVKTKTELRTKGQVALPVAFKKVDHGWQAIWLQLGLSGFPNCNQVENNRLSTTLLLSAIADRKYLTVSYLVYLLNLKGISVSYNSSDKFNTPITYIGLETPEVVEGSTCYTPTNFYELISLFKDKN